MIPTTRINNSALVGLFRMSEISHNVQIDDVKLTNLRSASRGQRLKTYIASLRRGRVDGAQSKDMTRMRFLSARTPVLGANFRS